jgi:hypothetical protein
MFIGYVTNGKCVIELSNSYSFGHILIAIVELP